MPEAQENPEDESRTTAAVPSPPPRRICWASLVTGIVLALMAIAATCVDVANNWRYGSTISPEIGAMWVLGSLGVLALPAAAALQGWNVILRAGTIVSVIVTISAAVMAYTDRQGTQIQNRVAARTAYTGAQHDAAAARAEIAAARAEAARITEPMSGHDLDRLAAEEDERAARERSEERGGCRTICKAAEANAISYRARAGQARAREAALWRAEKADERLQRALAKAKEAGPAEVSMLATHIAAHHGEDAVDVARWIALGSTALTIILTLLMAGLAHSAVSLIAQGFGTRTAGPVGNAPPVLSLRVERTADVVPESLIAIEDETSAKSKVCRKRMAPEERIQLFVAECLRRSDGDDVPSNELYSAFTTWWTCHAPRTEVPSQRTFGTAMTNADFERTKRGGKMYYANVVLLPVGVEVD